MLLYFLVLLNIIVLSLYISRVFCVFWRHYSTKGTQGEISEESIPCKKLSIPNFIRFPARMKMFKFGSKKDINTDYKCTIRLLDDTEVLQCDFKFDQKGQYLLDFVCNALNLVENDYFGLRYVDSHNQRHWLDPTRSILKQVKGLSPIVFCFRVKFYPAEPHRLKEEITRYQVFLQLRRDLLHGRLYCSQNDAALLAAYIIQSELGDHDSEEHPVNYVSDFKLLLKQTPRLEEKVAEIHQTQLRGQVPAIAEINFLRKACLLDTYGVDPHPVKDHKGNQMYLGINHVGILTFQGSRKTHHFKWPDIQKINYEGKMFIVHLMFNEKKHLIGFKCPTHAACHHLWKCAVEQKYFFTMSSSSEVPQVTSGGGLFSRGCKFRYSGRVEKEVVEDTKLIKRDQPHFQRCLIRPPSFRNKMIDNYSSSQPTSPNDISEDYSSSYINHSSSNAHNAVIENSDMVDADSLRSPTITSLPKDILEPLDEETKDSVIQSESFPFSVKPQDDEEESHNVNPSSKTCNATVTANHKGSLESDDSGSGSVHSDEENSEPSYPVVSALPISAAHCIEDFMPADMKIPKRRNPLSIPHSLPPHVNVMRGLVLASLFVLLLLSCLLVVVMESDSSLFSDIRKLPEMITLRREYYEPAKDYFVDQMNYLFKR